MPQVFDTRAEARTNNYRMLLEEAGWTVSIDVKRSEALRDPSGEVWSSGRVHCILTAKRQGEGYLIVSVVSIVDPRPGDDRGTYRQRAARRYNYDSALVELDTDTKFWDEFETMIDA